MSWSSTIPDLPQMRLRGEELDTAYFETRRDIASSFRNCQKKKYCARSSKFSAVSIEEMSKMCVEGSCAHHRIRKILLAHGRSDGLRDGRTEGRTEVRRDGGTKGRKDGPTEEGRERGTDGRTDGRTDGGRDGGTEGRRDGGRDGGTEGVREGGSE